MSDVAAGSAPIPAEGIALITIPVWNEERILESTVAALRSALDSAGLSYRLSIAEDGSTDGTREAINRLRLQYPGLLVIESDRRLGRGLALRRFWREVSADAYVFVDADLASGPESVARVTKAVLSGRPVVTGSRYCAGAEVHRPLVRKIVSVVYNRLVCLLFGDDVRDHQCGLKGFNRRAIQELLPLTREDTWAWDTEVLVLASKAGIPVMEVPVVWTEYRTSRTRWRRLWSDIWIHGLGILHLRAQFSRGGPAELQKVRDRYRSSLALETQSFTPTISRR